MEKESFPGMYDTSSAGHIPAGEEPLPSALRELSEELGMKSMTIIMKSHFATSQEGCYHHGSIPLDGGARVKCRGAVL